MAAVDFDLVYEVGLSMADAFVEHDFLAWLRQLPADDRLVVPIGDDAALLADGGKGILLAADTVVEGSHCLGGRGAAEILARKVVRANLSDIAAMGGIPESLLLNMVLPLTKAEEAARLILGIVAEECNQYNVALAGGDTVCAGELIILAASVTGRPIDQAITRAGAQLDDLIVVTGELGGSILGRHADFKPRLEEAKELVAHGPPSAMVDISDGLLRDLANILTASQKGAHILAEKIPVSQAAMRLAQDGSSKSALEHAFFDGEDFELLFTISEKRFEVLQRKWNMATKLSVIGAVVETGLVVEQDGEVRQVEPGGFDHGAEMKDAQHD